MSMPNSVSSLQVSGTILIVDDTPANLRVMIESLRIKGFKTLVATDGELALERAAYARPDLILLDVMLPDIDGFEICRRLKENIRTRDIPVIFMTALTSIQDKVRGFNVGAVDYVTKPIQQEEVLARVTTHLRLRDLTHRLQRKNLELETASQIGQQVTALLNREELLESIVQLIEVRFGDCVVSIWQTSKAGDRLILQANSQAWRGVSCAPGYELSLELTGIVSSAYHTGKMCIAHDASTDPLYQVVPELSDMRSELALPLQVGTRIIGILDVESVRCNAFDDEEPKVLQTLASYVAIALHNAQIYTRVKDFNEQLEHMVQERTSELIAAYAALSTERNLLRTLVDNLPDAIFVKTSDEHILLNNLAHARLLGLPDPDYMIGKTDHEFLPSSLADTIHTIEQEVLHTGQPHFNHEEVFPTHAASQEDFCMLTTRVPLRDAQGVISGLVGISRDITLLKKTQARIEKLNTELQQRLQHLSALRSIDMAITASQDLRLTLQVILTQTIAQLHVDAAAILLFNPLNQSLEYAARLGFHTDYLKGRRLRLGEGRASQAVLQGEAVFTSDIHLQDEGLQDPMKEGFVSYYAVPLIAKNQTKGVLELYHRSTLMLEPGWKTFLEALAGQAAIAIDNATLFDELQHAHSDLVQAYDSTIEGWARALDLRDKETEGHSQRVMTLTERLARAMNFSEAELVHIRRGALLHDIGKMGIPDQILLKPGPLNDEELQIMRLHPEYAYQMLAPIAYLRPAIDIPYCHHERWDGSGYPRRLKGQQIPLSARIFALVDVWDALNSDRPYRKAWPLQETWAHIRAGSGTHFDPQVVDTFVRIMAEDEMK